MPISSDPSLIPSYHVHVYYDKSTKHIAQSLREECIAYKNAYLPTTQNTINIGSMYDVPVGPHTKPMFLVAVAWFYLRPILNHLTLHRQGLSVLIHPQTGDEFKDHTDHVIWLGEKLPLDLSKL